MVPGSAADMHDGILNEMKRAAEANKWFELGVLITHVEKSVPLNDPSTTWLNTIAGVTKQNKDMLRKMQRASLFVKQEEDVIIQGILKNRPLSHIDVILRAINLDKNRGDELLDHYKKSGFRCTYSDLNGMYEKIRGNAVSLPAGKIRKTKAATGEFHRICMDILGGPEMLEIYRTLSERMDSAINARIWKGGHDIASPYATIRRSETHIIWRGDDKQIGFDGAECYMQYENDPDEVPRRRLLQAATEATLFDLFWIFLPDGQKGNYEELARRLATPNLGLIRVDLDTNKISKVLLPVGTPAPDRRGLWDEWSLRYVAELPSRRLKISK